MTPSEEVVAQQSLFRDARTRVDRPNFGSWFAIGVGAPDRSRPVLGSASHGNERASRVALVTGGGRGIGRAISLGLAADGVDVAVNYRKDEAAALDTVREIEALGRRAVAYQASIDSLEDDERMVARGPGRLRPRSTSS